MRLKDFERQFETLLLDEPAEHILRVLVNRPHAANSLSTKMGEEIIDVFLALAVSPAVYRCVILTAAGDRVFCAGADLKERDGMSDEAFQRQHYLFERMMRQIWECPVPVIAALNGHTMAGGLELALNCDFAYAVETAKFGFPEVKRGIMPGGAGTQHLPRRIGEARAKELILTGEPFSAAQALEWGVINRICAAGRLMEEVLETAGRICANAPLSTVQAKKSITHGLQMDVRTGMFFEIEAYYRLIPTRDRQEGINAFVEKRDPVFTGR
ncbi:enoyl-CoA hydratase-related protein [Mesorhizobium sp.]|uniref:enoyl-CoA hydratase-related protein n=1 Tax=Mesorhizobium sp. TaxID=1871066 RepID=UPI000FE436A5|nr:enoyl-CoA hydratase-related protein [Mesorhizobium sp.]RWH72896.1 MAG: enoyl-CoA hydratase [Mesorhizobium sp.]RWL34218.1 MAG: enoyl-CoA hydratase [Mesorhizobium sp.]RWL35634.1 MAG: enoyl-CoA hydratase [Mesorhizobium sp.]RWL41044.1 MAG: enoyl-CoA hydratase [Mesorhizobium sp.]RWL52190.1 MAG: enoyl-CoA hydratase [Mesorhizobium sp.]